jgi:AraC-like DNA-binding protein
VLRVVYAHRLLQDPGYTVEDVATRLGYQKPRSFVEHVKDVLGVTPADSRVSLSVEDAVDIVRRRYFRPQATIAEAS